VRYTTRLKDPTPSLTSQSFGILSKACVCGSVTQHCSLQGDIRSVASIVSIHVYRASALTNVYPPSNNSQLLRWTLWFFKMYFVHIINNPSASLYSRREHKDKSQKVMQHLQKRSALVHKSRSAALQESDARAFYSFA